MLSIYNTDTITHRTAIVRDKWGKTSGSPTETSIKARVEGASKEFSGKDGDIIVAAKAIFLPADASVSIEDEFDIDGETRKVIAIETLKDFTARGVKVWVK